MGRGCPRRDEKGEGPPTGAFQLDSLPGPSSTCQQQQPSPIRCHCHLRRPSPCPARTEGAGPLGASGPGPRSGRQTGDCRGASAKRHFEGGQALTGASQRPGGPEELQGEPGQQQGEPGPLQGRATQWQEGAGRRLRRSEGTGNRQTGSEQRPGLPELQRPGRPELQQRERERLQTGPAPGQAEGAGQQQAGPGLLAGGGAQLQRKQPGGPEHHRTGPGWRKRTQGRMGPQPG